MGGASVTVAGSGLSDEDLLKPKIAVVNSSSELAICFSHLDGIAKIVKEEVRAAGGLPFEIRTAAPSDFIIGAGSSGGYILASPRPHRERHGDRRRRRAAGRHDLPVLLRQDAAGAPHGRGTFQHPDHHRHRRLPTERQYNGKHVDIEDVFLGSVQASYGRLSKDTLRGMGDNAIRGPGVCSGMATANSMHVVCEALGMALPGSAPILANSPNMIENARRSGRRIVEMVLEDLKPRDILTAAHSITPSPRC